jgi:hypothetical protein
MRPGKILLVSSFLLAPLCAQQAPPIGVPAPSLGAGPFTIDTAEQHKIKVTVVARDSASTERGVSIALSGMTFYSGDKFPAWKGNVFVGGMRYGEIPGTGRLERVVFNDKMEELRRESLLTGLHQRIRDVRQGPDGFLCVLTRGDRRSAAEDRARSVKLRKPLACARGSETWSAVAEAYRAATARERLVFSTGVSTKLRPG